MVYRLSWVAGTGAILLALLRLNRLLRPGVEGIPWQVVLLAAGVLGAAITWAGIAYRLDSRLVAVVNLVAVVITAVRIAVPATTWFIFPTGSSFVEMRNELEFAREVIRAGVAPVIPLAGLVAILAILFWGLGALLSWGLLTGRPYLAVLTPLVIYLQFATMDRSPTSWWLWLFLAFLGAALLAVALDRRRDGTGLLTSPVTRLAVPRSMGTTAFTVVGAALLVTVLATQAVAGAVPRTGVLEWRVRTGLTGQYYGGISFNPFVGIHQGLVSQTNAPVFVAAVDGEVAPRQVYWRLLTLETFNGAQWFTDQPELNLPEDLDSYEDAGEAFLGETAAVSQDITILALQMGWLPAAYAPVEMTADNRTVARGFQVKGDASLRFGAITYRGMNYRVVSEVPQPDIDVLALGPDGSLSPVFLGAADDEAYAAGDTEVPAAAALADTGTYLDLPTGLGPIARLAEEQVDGLITDFEKALALEAFFRSPGTFSYSTDIDPGHSAEDLVAWLTDPDSPNYRIGYCEQFATAMAVMARQLDIPSRVVLGFTPGEVLDDGRVVVRDRNAHAWVELWMPTQGWVQFDPTPRDDGINPSTSGELPFPLASYLDIPEAGAPPATVPSQTPLIPSRDLSSEEIFLGSGSDADGTGGGGFSIPGWVPWAALGLLAAFGLLPGVKWLRRRTRMRRLAAGDISAAWRDIVDHLDDLGLRAQPSSTPLEVANVVSDRMVPLAATYEEQVYGDPSIGRESNVATAIRSLEDTKVALSMRYGRWRRLAAQYRLSSLVRRRRRRR